MGARFLLDLPEVLTSAGVPFIEFKDWEFRSRGSGGYDSGLPTHVMWHHTASHPYSDGLSDVTYMCYGSPAKPISNLYIDRSGNVWILAGGATNTNGVGDDVWGGGVPKDSMNRYAIGVEIANNGSGEQYSYAQHATIRKLGPALSLSYGIPVSHHRAHHEWAPTRKIDPAGPPTPWANPNNRNKWDMDQFRADIQQVLTDLQKPPPVTTPPKPVTPLPPTSGANMKYIEPPARGFDSRQAPLRARLQPGVHNIDLANFVGVSSQAEAVELTLTVVDPTATGYLTAWSGHGSKPNTSSLNYTKGGVICNTTVSRVKNGMFKVYTSAATYLIVDIIGYQ